MYKAPKTTKNKEQRDKGHIQFLKLVSAKAPGFLHIMYMYIYLGYIK